MQSYVGNVMAALIPRSRIVPAVDPNAMSVDPEVVKHYMEDPLNYIGNVRAKTGNELLQVGSAGLAWPPLGLLRQPHAAAAWLGNKCACACYAAASLEAWTCPHCVRSC
jgi:hypothetical protein